MQTVTFQGRVSFLERGRFFKYFIQTLFFYKNQKVVYFFSFCTYLKSVFCAVLRVCTVYLKWFLCKIFSSLYLLLICANANKTSHYRNYCVNKKQEFTSSFSKILFKTALQMRKLTHNGHNQGFFPKSVHFFSIFKKRYGRTSGPPTPDSCTPEVMQS